MVETVIDRSLATKTTFEGIHMPRLFIEEECLESCGKVRRLAAHALLAATLDPQTQYDVVALPKFGPFCRAEIQPTGHFNRDFGTPVDGNEGEYYLPNPGMLFEQGYTYHDRIERALARGAWLYYPSDLKSRFSI